MAPPKPNRCRRCGAPITQATTGRPRQFCSDAHRREWARVMAPLRDVQPPIGERSPFHSPDADRRLRALYIEARSLVRRSYAIANEMEIAGDPIECVRFAAAGTALERVLDQHFTDLEAWRDGNG